MLGISSSFGLEFFFVQVKRKGEKLVLKVSRRLRYGTFVYENFSFEV